MNIEKLTEAVLKSFIIGVMSFGVNYLRNIGIDMQKLNLNLIQLKYEIRTVSENQNSVNKSLMEKLESHEKRIQFIEKKSRR